MPKAAMIAASDMGKRCLGKRWSGAPQASIESTSPVKLGNKYARGINVCAASRSHGNSRQPQSTKLTSGESSVEE